MSEKLTAKEYAEKLLYTPEYAADKQADVKEKAAAHFSTSCSYLRGYKSCSARLHKGGTTHTVSTTAKHKVTSRRTIRRRRCCLRSRCFSRAARRSRAAMGS